MRTLPSRSSQSVSEAKCAAALMSTEDSIMQPSIVLSPSFRAASRASLAAVTPPVLTSFTFTPWKHRAHCSASRASWYDSSPTKGSGERSFSQRASASGASGGMGCSTNSILPSSARWRIRSRASSRVFHAALASTRMSLPGAARRTAAKLAASVGDPSFIFKIGYRAASRAFASIRSGVSRPMVKEERAPLAGKPSPRNWWSGNRAARAAPSSKAMSTAQRAGMLGSGSDSR